MNQNEQIIRKSLAEVFTKASQNDLLMLFHELREAYGEKHRGHHTLEHIAEVLQQLENFALNERRAFKAAALYHDFIYNPKNDGANGSNEELSAQACLRIMKRYGISTVISDRAMELIRMTEKHGDPDRDHDAALFLDIDMSILGAPVERYMRYARGIAHEYVPAVGPEIYFQRRTLFLSSLMGEKPIFKTADYAGLEKPARENAHRELDVLEYITRWATPSDIQPMPQIA